MKKTKLFFILVIICLGMCSCGNTGGYEQETKNVSGENNFSGEWIVVPGVYQNLSFSENNMIIAINENGKYGVFNETGELVVPFEYDYISEFNYGIASVEKDGKAFYIDEKGKAVWDEIYEDTRCFQEEVSPVKKDGLWGFIDLNGKITIPCQYDNVKAFVGGLTVVEKNGKWGVIDKNGELLVGYDYEEIHDFQEGYAAIRKENKWGFLNEKGNVAVECVYDEVKDFQEGYAAVMQNEKWGFIDQKGDVKIELQYDDAGNFSEGKAAVKICNYDGETDMWAYIDFQNQIVIDYATYNSVGGLMNYVGEFHDGLAFVSKDYYSVIDKQGDMVFDGAASQFIISSCSYDSENDIIPAYIYADKEMRVKKYGLIGLDGEQKLEPVFDYIGDIKGRYVIVYDKTDDDENLDMMGIIKLK